MFTGIIQNLGTVTDVGVSATSRTLLVKTGFPDLVPGESVAVSGVCLTVTELRNQDEACFFVSPETLDKSTLGRLTVGSRVNLERAVRLQDRLSGHLVQGHVDGMARVNGREKVAESTRIDLQLPAELARYCVPKGSITLNGVSLTLNEVSAQVEGFTRISVMIIPHTLTHTDLSLLKVSDPVNVEVDVIAKYVERLCPPH